MWYRVDRPAPDCFSTPSALSSMSSRDAVGREVLVRLTYLRVLMRPFEAAPALIRQCIDRLPLSGVQRHAGVSSGMSSFAAQNLAFSSDVSTTAPAASQAMRTCRTNHTIHASVGVERRRFLEHANGACWFPSLHELHASV
jgi:hypothetical protein